MEDWWNQVQPEVQEFLHTTNTVTPLVRSISSPGKSSLTRIPLGVNFTSHCKAKIIRKPNEVEKKWMYIMAAGEMEALLEPQSFMGGIVLGVMFCVVECKRVCEWGYYHIFRVLLLCFKPSFLSKPLACATLGQVLESAVPIRDDDTCDAPKMKSALREVSSLKSIKLLRRRHRLLVGSVKLLS